MRKYIPMAEVQTLDPNWADRIRVRERNKRRRLRDIGWSKNRARYMFHHVRYEAKKKGVKFDLTLEWFEARLQAGVCEMSGIPFDLESKKRKNSPSVDRKVPGGHYTPENCRMILYSINVALWNEGEDYIIGVFEHVIARRNAKR